MKDNQLVDKLMQSPKVRRLGLKKDSVLDILKTYNDIAFDALLEQGHLEVGNGMILEIVQLLDRVHVLRGVPYKSSRKYKIKLTMEQSVYEAIENYYDTLQEEIL